MQTRAARLDYLKIKTPATILVRSERVYSSHCLSLLKPQMSSDSPGKFFRLKWQITQTQKLPSFWRILNFENDVLITDKNFLNIRDRLYVADAVTLEHRLGLMSAIALFLEWTHGAIHMMRPRGGSCASR